jgi:hypothetical protein
MSPHQIEHHYPIDTGVDTFELCAGGGIEIMIR